MTVNFDTFAIEWFNGATWIDITADVQSDPPPRATRGIMSTDLTARVANAGTFEFTLDNSEKGGAVGRYTPGHSNCISPNWGKPYSYPVRVVVTYDVWTKYLWYGTFETADGVRVTPGSKGERKVSCKFRDWMGFANERKINLLTLSTYKDVSAAVQLLLAALDADERPQNTGYNQGDSPFAAVFDDLNSGTTVYAELAKLAASELGYIYCDWDKTTGEKLVVENRLLRYTAGGLTSSGGMTASTNLLFTDDTDFLFISGDTVTINEAFNRVTQIPKLPADCTNLQFTDGTDFLFIGDSETMLLHDKEDATFTEDDILKEREFSVRYHDNAFKSARISAQQKKIGTSTIVLWEMENPLKIKRNETLRGIRGRYRDPAGGASYINGMSFTTLVSGTDWKAYVNDDETGTNCTANITVTANPGSAEVEFTLYNSGQDCYITTLQQRGIGIFNYDSLDTVLGDDTGKKRIELNLHYQTDAAIGREYAYQLTRIANGAMTIQSFPIWVNRNSFCLRAFMALGIGSLYNISETVTEIQNDRPYFINGYQFEIISVEGHPNIIWTINGLPYKFAVAV